FEDAIVDRPGLLQMAGDGCVLLEDVDAMPLDLQERVLEYLVTGKIKRVGSERRESSDARLLFTLSRPVAEALADKKLRTDLCDRIARRCPLPPLRDRIEDVPRLA